MLRERRFFLIRHATFGRTDIRAPRGSNKQQTKTPTKKTLEFELREDEYGKTLLCLTDAGSETCYRRDED